MVAILLFWVLPILVILVIGLRRPGSRSVERWATRYRVPVDERTSQLIERYLTRTRRMRFSGALIAFVVSQSGAGTVPWANAFVFAIAGYLAGAVVAEATLPPPTAASRSALLSPRRLTSYVPRSGLTALVGLPVLTLAAAALFGAIDPAPRFGLVTPGTVIGAAAVAVVLATAVGAAMWAIVRRPQPAASSELAQLDDALRSCSLHAMNGAAVSLELLLVAFVLGQLQGAMAATSASGLQNLVALLALLSLAMAVASWVLLGHPRTWRSRRPLVAESSW